MNRLFLLIGLSLSLFSVNAQYEEITKWQISVLPKSKVDGEVTVTFSAAILKGWSLYSSDFQADIGPQPTSIQLFTNDTYELIGPIVPIAPLRKTDKTWGTEITFFTQKAQFQQKIKLVQSNFFLKGIIRGQVCNDRKGLCLPFEKEFSL